MGQEISQPRVQTTRTAVPAPVAAAPAAKAAAPAAQVGPAAQFSYFIETVICLVIDNESLRWKRAIPHSMLH